MRHRKIISKAIISVLMLSMMPAVSTCAESVTDIIASAGTTQSFLSDAVPEEDIEAILQAGTYAASAINQQPWFFAAITSQEIMEEIAGGGMGGMTMPGPKPEGKDMPSVPGGAPDIDSKTPDGPPASSSAKATIGDSPLAIVIYKNNATSSPNPDYDCGLATQNMVLAAASLGYGVKIVSSPTMALNGEKHDEICEKLGVDPALEAVAVLLVGKADDTVDSVSSASKRESVESKSGIIS